MTDYSGSDLFSSPGDSPYSTYSSSEKTKGAPWLFLLIGLVAVSLALFVKLAILHPQGDAAWAGHLIYWLISLLAFLTPIALFSIVDLRRQLDFNYPSNTKTVRFTRTAFLIVGLGLSLVNVYDLASELARVLNVG